MQIGIYTYKNRWPAAGSRKPDDEELTQLVPIYRESDPDPSASSGYHRDKNSVTPWKLSVTLWLILLTIKPKDH